MITTFSTNDKKIISNLLVGEITPVRWLVLSNDNLLWAAENKNGFQSFSFLFVGTENTTKSRISMTIDYEFSSLTM